jgi:hypothetical protein
MEIDTARKQIECYYCHKKGHVSSQCRKKQWDERNKERNLAVKQIENKVATTKRKFNPDTETKIELTNTQQDWITQNPLHEGCTHLGYRKTSDGRLTQTFLNTKD